MVVISLIISDKQLPKRESLYFQISCLYIGLSGLFFSFLIYLSILIKSKSLTNDFTECSAYGRYKPTCYRKCANLHYLLIIISRWFLICSCYLCGILTPLTCWAPWKPREWLRLNSHPRFMAWNKLWIQVGAEKWKRQFVKKVISGPGMMCFDQILSIIVISECFVRKSVITFWKKNWNTV